MNSTFHLIKHKEVVDYIIRFFTSEVTDPEFHRKVVESLLDSDQAERFQNNFYHRTFIATGSLSVSDFLLFAGTSEAQRIKEFEPRNYLAYHVLDVMCDCNLLRLQRFHDTGSDFTYFINHNLVAYLHKRNSVENLVYGFKYIVKKYEKSIYRIEVNEGGTGTGFLVSSILGGIKRYLIITNRHVADNSIKVFDFEKSQVNIEKIYFSNEMDLAAIQIEVEMDESGFYLYKDSEILDEVVVMGYPLIPMTPYSYQVAHRGEINGVMQDYWGKEYLLYSATTNPGNSGGPVLNRAGLVVGVATGQLTMQQQDTSVQPYFSAIKSDAVVKFLRNEVGVDPSCDQLSEDDSHLRTFSLLWR